MKSNGVYDHDVVIIGGGSAGYAAARTAANAGLNTAVVEGGEEVGGLCILRGCMPTKALLYAAEVMHQASHPEPWGIRTDGISFDFARVMARKDALIGNFAKYRRQQLTNGKFRFIRGKARFIDSHTLDISSFGWPSSVSAVNGRSAGEAGVVNGRLTARYFVIAAGSMVAPSPLAALDAIGYLTSDTALQLTKLPKSLIVLGGGAVALEFAQFYARFGVRITLIQRSPHVLHEMDSDAAGVIETVLRREGVNVFTGTKLLDARKLGALKEVSFEHEGEVRRILGEEVFFALGRVPNVASLGLERIGIQVEDGGVPANTQMQTVVPNVYAAGDCTGPYEIVHIAVQQGEIAGHNVARPEQAKEMDYRLRTEVVFTDPQIATVGLTEKQARAENRSYVAASYPFDDHGKSLIMEAKDGFVKLLAHPDTGEIIGGSCVGPVGGELIHEIIVAMAARMTVRQLAELPHYHPTLAEIWTYPAEELAARLPG